MLRRLLIAVVAITMAAPPVGSSGAGEVRPRVVIVQTVRVQPFQVAEEAIVRELGGSMDVRVVEVDPELGDAVDLVRSLDPDVVVPIGTQAASWAMHALDPTPVVFAMVLNPISGGLAKSFERPGGRVTGAALDISAETQFRAMRELLRAKRVAVLFNPGRSAEMVDAARREARRQGIELEAIPVESRATLEQSLRRVDGSFDALWSVPDPLVFSGKLAQRILLYTIRERIPLMGLSEQYVRAGALFALSTSYEENGLQAADRVRRVVAGERPGDIPIAVPERIEMVFNARTAETLRVDLGRVEFARTRPVR